MITPIKNDYIYQSTPLASSWDNILQLQGAGAAGSSLFTYNTFLGFGGGVWDPYYGPYRSHATAVKLATDGWTAGEKVDLTSRRTRTQVLAADGHGAFLFLIEATASGTSGVTPGYQVLTVDGTGVTEGSLSPISGDFTYDAAPTAVLPGTDTFFVHRAGDANTSPDVYTTPRASIDKVTIASGLASYTTVASGLAGYLDLRGVVPVDATTAYAVAGPLTMTGSDSTADELQLRFYKLTTTGGVAGFDDISFATPMEFTPPYAGTTSTYPVEIFSWGPDPDGAGPDSPTDGDVLRWGVGHDGTAFAMEQLALEQIDTTAQPPNLTGTNYTTSLTGAQYVPADGQLYVVRSTHDNSLSPPANLTYLRITQYDGASGAVVGEAWTAAPEPETGLRRNAGRFTAFYDASVNQLAVAVLETQTQTASPFHGQAGVRLATFTVGVDYPISQQLRSRGSAFLG